MGRSKALLTLGGETFLARIVRILKSQVENVVVVASLDQDLPPLSTEIRIVCDSVPEGGPLQGLRDGLRAIPTENDRVVLTGCDTPLMAPELIQLFDVVIGSKEAAIALVNDFRQPFPGIYRVAPTLAIVERLLEMGRSGLRDLLERLDLQIVPDDAIRRFDPEFLSFWNINTPTDYEEVFRFISAKSSSAHADP